MIRCRILNFKNFDFILMVIKYRVPRFNLSQVRVLDKFPHGERFFSPYGKNLLPCGKFNDIDAKHKQKSVTLLGRELAKDKLFILWLEDLPYSKIFLPYGKKNLLPCGNLSRTPTGLGAKRRTLYFLNFKINNENVKSFTRWLESPQINTRIVKTPFYFMRLSL
jgi:hypothetical protein